MENYSIAKKCYIMVNKSSMKYDVMESRQIFVKLDGNFLANKLSDFKKYILKDNFTIVLLWSVEQQPSLTCFK